MPGTERLLIIFRAPEIRDECRLERGHQSVGRKIGFTNPARCPFRNSLASSLDLALIRPRRVEVAFKLLGPWTKPRAPLPLLTACLTEWSTSHQGCPGIGPTVRMGMTTVIVLDKRK